MIHLIFIPNITCKKNFYLCFTNEELRLKEEKNLDREHNATFHFPAMKIDSLSLVCDLTWHRLSVFSY